MAVLPLAFRREHNWSLSHRRLGRAVPGDSYQLNRRRLVPGTKTRPLLRFRRVQNLGIPILFKGNRKLSNLDLGSLRKPWMVVNYRRVSLSAPDRRRGRACRATDPSFRGRSAVRLESQKSSRRNARRGNSGDRTESQVGRLLRGNGIHGTTKTSLRADRYKPPLSAHFLRSASRRR